jgi:Na+-driven multidrug efflux pump
MHAPQLIRIAAGIASLGFSVALANAIAVHPRSVEEFARRRIDRAMLGFLVTVGWSIVAASTLPDS